MQTAPNPILRDAALAVFEDGSRSPFQSFTDLFKPIEALAAHRSKPDQSVPAPFLHPCLLFPGAKAKASLSFWIWKRSSGREVLNASNRFDRAAALSIILRIR